MGWGAEGEGLEGEGGGVSELEVSGGEKEEGHGELGPPADKVRGEGKGGGEEGRGGGGGERERLERE